jgi:DNA repair protein RadA/Sms
MSNLRVPNRHGLVALPGGKLPKYECYCCHEQTSNREPRCPGCGRFDTLIREEPEEPTFNEGSRAVQASKLRAKRLRVYSSGSEAWDTALGGGFVKPSSVLLYGPRGIGKSTRALQIALHLASLTRGKALVGSAEMPAEHVRRYAERLGASHTELSRLWIQDSSDALDLLANIEQERPAVVVWDSIQRFTWEGELGDVELRQVVHHALEATKHYKLISLFLSQVTKDEIFLGPNGIGHDVDVMVRLSREDGDLIIEIPDKNRFAPTPMRARERFLAEPKEPDAIDQLPREKTIDQDQATADWFRRKPGTPTDGS